MNEAQTTQEAMEIIGTHLQAHYKLMYTVTPEEKRARTILKEVASRKGIDKVYSWTFGNGVVEITDPNDNGQEMSPMDLLNFIDGHEGKAMFILNDLHFFLETKKGSCYEFVRRLKDFLNAKNKHYKPIMIVSSIKVIPPEIEKHITLLNIPLPDEEDIGALVDKVTESLRQRQEQFASDGVQFELPDKQERERLIKACKGLSQDEIENILAKSCVKHHKLDPSIVMQEKEQIIKKNGLLEYHHGETSMDEVGGMNILKEWLARRGAAFSNAARDFGLRQPKGTLLLGPPGTGKTFISKAIATQWGLPMIKMDVGKVFGGIVGQSEENMRRAISTVESIAPCVLMIDEIEKGLSGTGSSNFSDGGTTNRVFATFLSWMQERNSPVFIVATANDVQQLPPELLRKGRFDEIFFVDFPTFEERKEILRIHIEKGRQNHPGRDPENFDLDELAELSEDYTGAELEETVIEGLFEAFTDEEADDLTQAHLVNAIRNTQPLKNTMREKIERLLQWVDGRARFASSGAEDLYDVRKEEFTKSAPRGSEKRKKIADADPEDRIGNLDFGSGDGSLIDSLKDDDEKSA